MGVSGSPLVPLDFGGVQKGICQSEDGRSWNKFRRGHRCHFVRERFKVLESFQVVSVYVLGRSVSYMSSQSLLRFRLKIVIIESLEWCRKAYANQKMV